jgi:hypothetical protein
MRSVEKGFEFLGHFVSLQVHRIGRRPDQGGEVRSDTRLRYGQPAHEVLHDTKTVRGQKLREAQGVFIEGWIGGWGVIQQRLFGLAILCEMRSLFQVMRFVLEPATCLLFLVLWPSVPCLWC